MADSKARSLHMICMEEWNTACAACGLGRKIEVEGPVYLTNAARGCSVRKSLMALSSRG